jgi:LysM repeat protein
LAAAEPAAPTGRAAYRQHVVKEGESLWKIARLYKAKVDEIVKLNELEKDKLYPGMTLQIPHGTGSEPPR